MSNPTDRGQDTDRAERGIDTTADYHDTLVRYTEKSSDRIEWALEMIVDKQAGMAVGDPDQKQYKCPTEHGEAWFQFQIDAAESGAYRIHIDVWGNEEAVQALCEIINRELSHAL